MQYRTRRPISFIKHTGSQQMTTVPEGEVVTAIRVEDVTDKFHRDGFTRMLKRAAMEDERVVIFNWDGQARSARIEVDVVAVEAQRPARLSDRWR